MVIDAQSSPRAARGSSLRDGFLNEADCSCRAIVLLRLKRHRAPMRLTISPEIATGSSGGPAFLRAGREAFATVRGHFADTDRAPEPQPR